MHNSQFYRQKNTVHRNKKHFTFFRGLCAFTLFGFALSVFEVEPQASEPTWTQDAELVFQQDTVKDPSISSLNGVEPSSIFPESIREQVGIQERISTKKWMKQLLKEQLTDDAMAYLIEDLSLYTDFLILDEEYVVFVEHIPMSQDTVDGNQAAHEKIVAISLAKSKYDRLRIEISPNRTSVDERSSAVNIMKDCFPLDLELAHIKFDVVDFFEGTPLVDKILEKEPQLLAYIDSKVNVVRQLDPTDQIQVLLQGRFRDGKLRQLDEVLAIKLTHQKMIEDKDSSKKSKKSKNTKKNKNSKSNSSIKYTTHSYLFHKVELEPIFDEKDKASSSQNANQPPQNISLWFDDNHRVVSYPFLKTPTDHIIVSSGYGEVRSYEIHKAIDFAAPTGTPIYASAAGTVRKSGVGTGYGYMVHIDHKQLGTYSSLYAHMSKRAVRTGEYVQQGQLIGYVGETGRSTGPHLHYEVRKSNRKVNPYSRSISKSFRKGYSLQDHRADVILNYKKISKMFNDIQHLPTEEMSYLNIHK